VSDTARVSGDAWVFGDAQVSGNARVSGNAQVFGNARVFGVRDLFTVGPAGSEPSTWTVHRDSVLGWRVNTGCWTGRIDDAVTDTGGDDPIHVAERVAVLELIRTLTTIRDEERT
jgi:hypothetical protein